ncbi:Trichodiene oxygenase protein [Rutstroemia sp. NJR-2017a BVV2]|nr:Trichodiene oxygenase protein [Rutstroemia sp. NJR-2017a BVV2]
METLSSLLSLQNIAATIIIYFGSLAFYRLFLHPLARFPGPRLAAITRYYEAYYDIVKNGQYTFKIVEMHKKYGTIPSLHDLSFIDTDCGSIIRISPYELHVIDPDFFEKLYRQDGRWDKYAWALNGFSAGGATICTADHDVHKARRLPLNPFFSQAQVANKQSLIRRHVQKFCDRISQLSETEQIVNLGAAMSAFTRDVSTEFILGKTYNSLDKEDFDVGMTNVFQGSGHIWRITKHITWFGPTMKAIPMDWVMKIADEGTKAFFRYLKETTQDTKELLNTIALSDSKDKAPRTIVHEILDSSLPAKDKEFDRVFDDVATVIGAGFETTASVLRLIIFHVFNDAEILQRLRKELHSASIFSSDETDLKKLEQLLYLTSILMEGMRLSPAIATRSARIAPDRDLTYEEWRIPAGTPIGMTTLLIHTDEKIYPDPLRFNPGRWMDLDTRRKNDKTYAPFSRGTRICLGMNLAWAEMYMLLAALVQRFNFRFEGLTSKDFECESDQFIIGTSGKGVLKAFMNSNTTQYEALAEQIEIILRDPEGAAAQIRDEGTLRRLSEAGRKLAVSLEQPRDTLRRIGYSHLQLPLALVGVETKLFSTLAAEPRAFSIAELTERTGMEGSLLKRLLRYYQATDIIAQNDDDTYQSTNVTRALSNNDHANSLRWTRKITAQGALNLPDWLQSHQYKDPVGILPTAWSSVLHTDKHPYGWLADNPWALELAQSHMRVQREGRPLFFDALDFQKRFGQNTTSSTVLFVDVGGSTGPQSRTLRQRFPDLPGRVILQDRPEVIDQAKADLASARIEAEVHDIFTPQPIKGSTVEETSQLTFSSSHRKGARAYYLRNIFHAWEDATCLKILENAKVGLTDQSVILIDEIVLPERDATTQGAQHDIEVMICVGGIERTKAQWERLLNSAGLKILEVVNYDKDFEDCVIIAVIMDSYQLLSLKVVAATFAVYCASLAFYRLFLHPLAKFPGPKLAAITLWYEAYYDLVLEGQYTFKIAQMHKIYAPIIRISPYELHIINHNFCDKLYGQHDGRDKDQWACNEFIANLVQARTEAQRLKVPQSAARQDVVIRNVNKLCNALMHRVGSTINLEAALGALVQDLYVWKSRQRRFQCCRGGYVPERRVLLALLETFSPVGRALKSIPLNMVSWLLLPVIKTVERLTPLQEIDKVTARLLNTASSSTTDEDKPYTIVHEIADSDLPPADKSLPRVLNEVQTIVGAGLETVSGVLDWCYMILQRLRAELRTLSSSDDLMDLKKLEQLPYLTSIITEALRMSPAIGSRMGRIVPDKDTLYGDWTIPAGMTVGMTTILMHNDETLYPDPFSFNPDRWMDMEKRKKFGRIYAPFSRGSRMCAGMYLAWADLYFTLAALAPRFNFKFQDIQASDFRMVRDEFIIGTKAKSLLKCRVTLSEA